MSQWITWKDGKRMLAERGQNGEFYYLREATQEDLDNMYSGGGIKYDRETDPTIQGWENLARNS